MEDKIVSREIIVSSLKAEGFRLGHNRSNKSKILKKQSRENSLASLIVPWENTSQFSCLSTHFSLETTTVHKHSTWEYVCTDRMQP